MRNAKIAALLLVLMALVLALNSSSLSDSLAQDGRDPGEDQDAIVDVYTPIDESALGPQQQPALHSGHLGYDKETGQFLDDPTVHTSLVRSPEEQAAYERYYNEKLAGVDPTRLTFRSGLTIHPQPGMAPSVREQLMSGDNDYYLIQFSYPFPTQARYRLEEIGVTFYDYVGVSGMYARVPAQALETLQNTIAKGAILYVGSIPTQAKVEPNLAAQAEASPKMEHSVIVLTFDEPTPAQLEELQKLLTIDRRSDGPMHILEGQALGSSIQELARLGYIRWVEPQQVNTLGNLEGGMGIGSDIVRGTLGFDGTGVQVMVVDTGIARDGTTYHPDLQASRILDQYDYQNTDTNAADDNSHGSHVAGSIGGLYDNGNMNSVEAWQGVAPGADLLIYKLCCGGDQFSSVWFQQSLERATSGGRTAHISNNSWGGGNGTYSTHSEIADRAVRGEYNSEPINMVILSHNDDDLACAPGTGKNVITVGSVKDGNYPDIAFTTCGTTDDYNWPPGERVCYSNYGPIDTDGDTNTRVKPDVMAPGAMIFSTTPWYLGGYDYYGFKHGTSMATPHVSGALAQILDAHSSSNPWLFDWPMVVKAMLLATTVDVGGNTDLYGHGLVNPYHAIYYQAGVDAPMSFWGNSVATTGETKDFTFNVPDGYEEVRVVLTWADPAGSNEVDNDLDISSVRDANGVHRGSSSAPDDPVEYVKITAPYASGTWTVTVSAFSLSSGQSFGLVTHPIMADADLSISADAPVGVGPGDYFYYHQYVSNSGYTAGGSYARLYVPDGFTVHGARIYTEDGIEHYYDDSELRHVAGDNYWRAALGSTLAWYDRHVRWYIQADSSIVGETYTFTDRAYWREGGSLGSSDLGETDIIVPLLTIAADGTGSGTVDPASGQHTYGMNDIANLAATAAPGSKFVGWNGALSGSTNPTSLLMDGHKTITATFELIEIYLPLVLR
ncbi:MAG: S8 family serine peptidase [Chloroflexi bacterium]|nr:S8 family serine peptidase [Chloroflexota bacterium]